MPRTDYQPRWVAFCAAHGYVLGEATADDKARVRRNVEFMTWIRRQWAAWRVLNSVQPNAPLSEVQVAAFDAWLTPEPMWEAV